MCQSPHTGQPITDESRRAVSAPRLRMDNCRSTRSTSARQRRITRRAASELSALLGRRPVNLDTPELQRFIAGKVVLVTGAGGSIGSEICRQSMKFCPGRLVLLDRAENSLFEIERELVERWIGAQIVPVV